MTSHQVLHTLILALASTGAFAAAGTAPASPDPKLLFDQQGRLILVLTPDGRHCAYHYSPEGALMAPANPSCGNPEDWLKAKAGG